jgi:hypothetical protein
VAVLQISTEVEKEDKLYRLLKSKEKESCLRKKFLEFLLLQVYIIVAAERENLYNNISETLASVILRIQQENIFAAQQIKEIQRIYQADKDLLL